MAAKVSALDIGAGNTKSIASIDGRIVHSGFFPSVVSLPTAGALASFRTDRSVAKEVMPVVDGVTYTVSLANGRNLTGATRVSPGDDFQNSAHHSALLAAGLHASGLEDIDVLVVGTPVLTFEKHRERLAAIRGLVDFGLGRHRIGMTIPLPQPFGSLLSSINEGTLPNSTSGAQLVIDVGYYTIDILRTRRLVVENAYSFSLETGMGKIYRVIADALAHQLRKPVTNLDEVEYCLRNHTPYQAYGKQIFLHQFTHEIQAHINAFVLEIYGRSGTTEDLTGICLTGGGAEFFLAAIRKQFGDIPVSVTRDPLMANAKGFLIAGQSAANSTVS